MAGETWRFESGIRPEHLTQGLGAAERELLCTCLALFDDSTFLARLSGWVQKGKRYVVEEAPDAEVAVDGLRVAQARWMEESGLSDDELRTLLWIRLRQALALPPRLSASRKGVLGLGDDVAAALISALDPPGAVESGRRWLRKRGWLEEQEPALALEDIVVPVLDEFLESSLEQEDADVTPVDRRALLEAVLKRMTRLDATDQRPLLDRMDVNRANDSAALTILLTGAGLASFGTAVNLAGFSAYILAAQASAFIPLVSGPGLVSFVSVLSNPITIIAATLGVGSVLHSRAKRQVGALVAARVVAMLVLSGLRSEGETHHRLVEAFARVEELEFDEVEGLKSTVIDGYRKEWRLVRGKATRREKPLDPALERPMRRPVSAFVETGKDGKRDELVNAMALAGLTVGDLLYSAAAIDPLLLKAADFAHAANLQGRIEFAEFANALLDGEAASVAGSVSRLEGYVAEHAVAAQLTASGHAVDFPASSTNEGWDLLIDGRPFQVKFREGIGGIQEHFQRFDYPVIANIELADRIPEELVGRVFFVEGLGTETVEAITESSLSAGDALVDPEVPALAFVVSVSRGALNVHRGRATPLQAVEQVMLDGTVRVGLAAAGGAAGPVLGMILFGPAGAWVFGVGAPIIAQSFTTRITGRFGRFFQFARMKAWVAECNRDLDALRAAIKTGLNSKREQFRRKIERCPVNDAGRYLRWRLWDEVRFLEETERRLDVPSRTGKDAPESRLSELLRIVSMASLHPVTFQLELVRATDSIQRRPGLVDELRQMADSETVGEARKGVLRLADWLDREDARTGVTKGIDDFFRQIFIQGGPKKK